jgi:hypothetical protein
VYNLNYSRTSLGVLLVQIGREIISRSTWTKKLNTTDLDNRQWGCQPYALAEPSPPGKIFWNSFILETESTPRVIVRLKGLGKLQKCNDFIGNRTHVIPACGIVLQPTKLSRIVALQYFSKYRYVSQIKCLLFSISKLPFHTSIVSRERSNIWLPSTDSC